MKIMYFSELNPSIASEAALLMSPKAQAHPSDRPFSPPQHLPDLSKGRTSRRDRLLVP